MSWHNVKHVHCGTVSDHVRFIKPALNDTTFTGPDSQLWWNYLISYLKHLGNRQNFNHLIMHELDVELPGSTTVFTTPADLPPELDQSIQYIYENLIPSFRNPKYRNRWIESYKKGYDIFMKEIHELGPPHFMYMGENDNVVRGVEGAMIWEAIIKLLECLGETGFEDLLHRIDNLPENYKKEDLVKKETVPPNYHVDMALRPVVEEIKDANTTKN